MSPELTDTIQRLAAAGVPRREIAAGLGLDLAAVRRALRRPPASEALAVYEEHRKALDAAGERLAAVIEEQLR